MAVFQVFIDTKSASRRNTNVFSTDKVFEIFAEKIHPPHSRNDRGIIEDDLYSICQDHFQYNETIKQKKMSGRYTNGSCDILPEKKRIAVLIDHLDSFWHHPARRWSLLLMAPRSMNV